MSVEEVDTLLQGVVTCGTNADEVALEKLREIPLLQLSRMMGKYLTGEEHVVNAVRVLGLATVNRRDRTIEEVDVMLRFFSRKLSSMQTIAVAVESTALLVRELSSEGPCTSDVFNVLHTEFLQSFSLQALPTNVRSWGYDVLRFTVTKETATWFTTPFLQVVLKSMDEENEPELLMRALELHHIIASYAREDAMQPLLEEYFDSISSYFPVVFSQPPGCKVSKEDLRRVLSACMTHPLYLNICVPFLLSRMASPSSVVKQESTNALLNIFSLDSSHTTESLCPHVVSVTNHIRNEVVRAVSLGSGECEPYVKDCVHVLKFISKRAQDVSLSIVRSWLEPMTSGALASLRSGPAVCSAYATMFYHLVSSSTCCGAATVQCFLLQLLSNTREDSFEVDDAVLIISAILSGIFDAGNGGECGKRPPPQRDVKEGLETVSEKLFQLVEKLTLSLQKADASSVHVRCELLASLVTLAAWLPHWMPDDTVLLIYKRLIALCLCGDEEVGNRVVKHISRIGSVEGNLLNVALLDMPADINPTAAGILTLYKGLLGSQASLSLAATKSLLECPEGLFGFTLTERDVFSLCRSSLSAHADYSTEDIRCLLLLTKKRNSVASFDYLCDLLLLLPIAFVPSVLQEVGGEQWGVLTASLVSCFDMDVLGASDHIEHWMCEVLDAMRSTPTDVLTMQSVSLLCARVPGVAGRFLEAAKRLNPTTQLAARAAVARGLLACGVAEGGIIELIIEEITNSLRSGYVQDCYVDILTGVFVFCYQGCRKTTTLILPLVHAATRGSKPVSLELLRVVAKLLQDVSPTCGLEWGDIVEFSRRVSKPLNEEFVNELVELLDLALSQMDPKNVLVEALLGTDDLLPLVLSGVRSPLLKVRCTSLRLLSEAALFVMQFSSENGDSGNSYMSSALQVRDEVLHVSQVALNDHKRMVRRSAAQCRHQWYKLK
ncbi:hypothetical protein, conserved [Trypanosoma brucei brucei TREU927]|uniref:MMS19 nucleotide excision repair protein n=1 Tax=Trypanosoma brucei brucei (strain 927/4 GUTat10.1) TaxID=185431 RepID=Q57YW3_TRYB2|nr:hypothetical protein, conserved [Trypanosoma brucei brucei TREU927]AAX79669.1 hypothetical protein, conserved [Trypanosoma brucei]AAZ13115.1 hypothetical protein, conserved [Trypanosoma brucei brucei TREU927]